MDLYNLRYKIKQEDDDNGSNSISSIRISPNGKFFAIAINTKIKIYNLESKQLIYQLKNGHSKGINDIQFSPIDSNIIASCSDDMKIILWNLSTQKIIKILKKHNYHITTIKFVNKGNLLISGSSDENIIIWDLTSFKIITTLSAHLDPVSSISLTFDDSLIISGAYDGLMRIFDLETSQCLKTLTTATTSHGTATASTSEVINYPISHVESSPNGLYILSSSLDGNIRLWKYIDNKIIKTFQGLNGDYICRKYNCESRFITKLSNISLICSGSDKDGLIIWDIQLKEILFNYNDHKKEMINNDDDQIIDTFPILSLDIYNNGEILITGSKDGIINLFDLNENYNYNREKSVENGSLI